MVNGVTLRPALDQFSWIQKIAKSIRGPYYIKISQGTIHWLAYPVDMKNAAVWHEHQSRLPQRSMEIGETQLRLVAETASFLYENKKPIRSGFCADAGALRYIIEIAS